MLKTEDGLVTISFLEKKDEKKDENAVFCWPVQATVETVDAEQVFVADLQAKGTNTNRITFPRIREIKKAFSQCKEALLKRFKISQVIG